MRNLLASLFFLSLTLIPSHSHPLCLDAEPPFSFSSSDNSLDFCKEYSTFGCCTREDDRRIQAVHDDYIKTAPSTNCSSYLRTLLCLECSPYAAHVFDAEGATTTTSRKYFPGLCTGYCNDLYRTCKEIIPVVTSDSRIRNAVAAGQQAFCNEARISDMIYCYPDIINNTDLNQVIIRQQSGEQGCLCLETFATQLRNALLLVYPNDGTGRIFVGEQLGLVSIYYKNGTKLPELFMDISYLVLTSSSPGDERGFLGMVFHPNFTTNQHFYVYFTIGTNGAFRTRISEFTTMSSNPNKVDVHSERVLLEIDQPFSNHNGGEMLFGFDGYLYVTVGDGGAGGDPYNNGQNLSALLGKILRIDVNGRTNNRQYDIPPTNPFIVTPNARPEIYAYGLRNTWRCSFDKGDFVTGAGRGRLFCGDVGQSRYEEIDIIKSGLNYGWRAREGFECYDSNMCGRIGPEELPIFAYGRDLGQSVTGGYVYRGCHYPSLNGLYIYGDYSSGRIFRLKDIGQPVWENKEILMCQSQYCTNGLKNTYERNILSFGEDFDGDVYILTTSNPSPTSFSGSIYRLVDPLRRNDPTLCTAGSSLTSQSSSGPTSSTSVTPSSTSKPSSTSPSPTSTSPQKPTDNSTQSSSRVTNQKTTPVSSAPSTTTPAPSTATTTTTFSSSSAKIQTTTSQTQRSSSSVTRNTSPQITPTRSATSVDVIERTQSGQASENLVQQVTHGLTKLTHAAEKKSSKTVTKPRIQKNSNDERASSTTEGIIGNDSPVIWSCDFEDPSGKPTWCSMQQATDDNFDWTILSGPTPSDPTGPDQAYKGQYYIYIEASNPRKSNDTAKIYIPVPINSPVAAGQFCLSFAYHMFGFHIREIRLITENSADGASNNMIWHQVKEKENFWLTAKVTINLQSGAKMAFFGIRGDEYSGDIALDDIKLQNGRC